MMLTALMQNSMHSLLLGIVTTGLVLTVLAVIAPENDYRRLPSRHLMSVDDGEPVTDDDTLPVPLLDFWLSGESVPNHIDGGSVLTYNWRLQHRVQPEYTAINITFEVDFPFLSFHKDSVNIALSSHTFGMMNGTYINPIDVTWLQQESKIQLTVDVSEPLWINLTKPWRLPDCWWTPVKQCYQTTYQDCILYDASVEQNWDPASCSQFNVSQCLPHNTTSECFFLHPNECRTRLLNTLAGDPSEFLCSIQPNTSCIQINDRGLFFDQYDWTVPTKPPVKTSYQKELCGLSTSEIFMYEEDHNGTIYNVDIILSQDSERHCHTVLMKLQPGPPTPEPTYDPYRDLPITMQYSDAKECINVNTSGFYQPPPDPIHWQDFNLTVLLTGELSNFVEVNQMFEPLLTANLSQSSRPPPDQLTSVLATMTYTIRKATLKLYPYPSFSEEKHILKHEQIFYLLHLKHPEARNHGIELTVSLPAVDGQVRMTFINETPWWVIGANLVTTTHGAMINATCDEAGHEVTIETVQSVIADQTPPEITASFLSTDPALGILDQLVFHIDPFITLQDQTNNAMGVLRFWFYSRALTNVLADQELSITATAAYLFSRSDFHTTHTPVLTVTVQPFIPLIPAANPDQAPDTADFVHYTFDLSHVLDFYVQDIWMNVSCPDLRIVPDTLEMEFLEPDVNTTTNSSIDLSWTSETTYSVHLPMLAPGVNLIGNQTFLMWNNSMLTHQEIICNVWLSYRKESEALILPYLAGLSSALTLPGISCALYPKDLLGSNDTMYMMSVGSNTTYILNITFPETSTRLGVTLAMPMTVLAVYYAHIIHQGARLTLNDTGIMAVQTTSAYIDEWDVSSRTTVHLDFGMVQNLADNKLNSTGDNLILEFNVVLQNTTGLVSRDMEHILTTTVSYSNGEDLIQQETIRVWEPEVMLILNMTNHTNAGDSGDVFQYRIHLSHTELSQSPAHHVVIELHLPYMAVYLDFIPSNDSHAPTTKIYDGLGPYQADGKLRLYLYKLPLGEVIDGTFLIQISTKLTKGIALQATSRYHMYSFYQWGRVYHFSGVSENVINIRNATLIFDRTSHSQSPDNQVTIHEQVMYTMRVPVPPIPSNLSVALDLPRHQLVFKTWEVLSLKETVPLRLPIEETFLRQGCFSTDTITDACFCSDSPSGNGTFYRVYPDWLNSCEEIPKENCTGVNVDSIIEGLAENGSTGNTTCNGTSLNCTHCGYNSSGNCSTANQTIEYDSVSAPQVCIYHDWLYDACLQTVLKECLMNSSIPGLWSHIFQKAPDQGSSANGSLTSHAPEDNWNQTQATPSQLLQTNQTTSNHTLANHTTPSPSYANQTITNHSLLANQTTDTDEYSSGLSCTEFAKAFCQVAALRQCVLPETVHNDTDGDDRNTTCACHYYEPPSVETTTQAQTEGLSSNGTQDPYQECRHLSVSSTVTAPFPDPNETTTVPSVPSVCDDEEQVLFGLSSVVRTDIWSSREGSVCTFVGGNRHNPFHPGVYYISEHLPANLSEGGSTVQVTVTMVILDLPELNRGDVLILNATSIFSYVSYPIPPSDIFRENCTCRKPLEHHVDQQAPKECFCDTWHLANVTVDECNCTSYYVDEGDAFTGSLSCNCINYCWRRVVYFLNPPHIAALQQFNAQSCDCLTLNATIASRGPASSLHRHVENCLQPYKRNYSCRDLHYTVTHHDISLDVNCTCPSATVEGATQTLCSCDTGEILAKLQDPFTGNVSVQYCMNSTAVFDGELFLRTFNDSDCSCQDVEESSTVLSDTTSGHATNDSYSTVRAPTAGSVKLSCRCHMTCGVHVEQDCSGLDGGRCANITHTHTISLPNATCQCQKMYKSPLNISEVLDWYQLRNDSTEITPRSNLSNFGPGYINASFAGLNGTWFGNATSNGTFDTVLNITELANRTYTYGLECDCLDIGKVVLHVEPFKCREEPAFESYDCECFVPPDNETQYTLDNWDDNATIINQMITRKSHQVVIVEPELEISFTRHLEPSIIDSIDPIVFDFQISHTAESNAPAFNVTLQLDAINFTRTSGSAELQLSSDEEPSCVGGSTLCDVSYDNAIGRFHLPLLPVEPTGAIFKGFFNLSVGNHIDFVANSLITASGIAWYDSSLIDFPGRLYPSIVASDTVQVHAPTISAKLDFTTANSMMFFTSQYGAPPQTFSIGDHVRMEAKLWIPEITLQFLNFSMEGVMQNFTASSGRVLLSDRVYHRNDTASIYLELEADPEASEGYLYPGQQYNSARFLETGITVVPGVLVNEADNVADEQDFIFLYFTFRVKDQPYWAQGVDIPFTVSAAYVSDYIRASVVLKDESIVLTVVEPQLSLRVELLDHPWQLDQVRQESGYTCVENTCCASEECIQGRTCVTAVDNMQDCTTSECHCYSGFASNKEEGCTAVGRTAGDIITYGLTATHHVDFTGNAFDVFIVLHSELPSDVVPNTHFISHSPPTNPQEAPHYPSLQQRSDRAFELYIQRFNQAQMCERFTVSHRIRPDVEVFPGKTWMTQATMWYYSAKPYGTLVQHNTESRLYHTPDNITFNLTAPAPSARFYMLPPAAGGSSAVDFRVYSSSERLHQVTVNLRDETSVRFRLEVVVPKIRCNLTILLALPQGDGFKFESVRITEMGSQIIFPSEKLSNKSLTSDLEGNRFFYAELPGIYSQPYATDKQREFNSTIQQRFKTMKGEQRPYPTVPSCLPVNRSHYEKSVLLGCFHDVNHHFDVAMATQDQPEHVNVTKAMTRNLCLKLCRNANWLISATKNGSDCYCGNHTAYRRYADVAHSLYTPVNRTFLEPLTETVYYDCNQTRKEWNNSTVTYTCMDQDTYETCKRDMNQRCENETETMCLENFALHCQDKAELVCNGTMDVDCLAVEIPDCTRNETLLCSELARKTCGSLVQEPCLEQARESYYLTNDFRMMDVEQKCCIDAYVNICTATHNASCLANDYESCTLEVSQNCTVEGRDICLNTSATFWNQSASHCDFPTVTWHNRTTSSCSLQLLPNCSYCLIEGLEACEVRNQGGSTQGCIEVAVHNCSASCILEDCHHEFHEVLVRRWYSNCSRLEAESFDMLYTANCSQDITTWGNVTREVMDTEPVTLDFCNMTCSGDSYSTCGSEAFVLIYGPLEGSLAQQQCECYAGLYNSYEDVFSLEFELSITPLLTKGVTEILQPFVSYDHGKDRKPTILPFAPYRLEAGGIRLNMNVWVAPETEGFVPGDMLEFYTEVFHNPLSTLTARDISIVWMFPTYVDYVNLTNHQTSLHDYSTLQPVEALRTDPTKGFQFYVSTLRNTHMISFHFLVKLDPGRALRQGEYHMVALAETYYFSWDLYNAHEDEYKHNVVTHHHSVIPTKISFEVPTSYIGRPELEDVKLSTYNVLYDEAHNIMYACFYNNSKQVYKGGCFMTGNLPPYKVETPPTCEDYCNCTYVWDPSSGANCSEFEPKPENCSCGCLPDCMEHQSACEASCYNCTRCSYEELQVCLTGCSNSQSNCSQDCCLDTCSSQHDDCLFNCSNCHTELDNCTIDFNCSLDCFWSHDLCATKCITTPVTCKDNCTTGRSECSRTCEQVCQGQMEVYYPGLELNCTLVCDWDCNWEESWCLKTCCYNECDSNRTLCGDICLYSCKDDDDCVHECLVACSNSLELCDISCDPPKVPCSQPCVAELSHCTSDCNQTCAGEICEVISSEGICSEVIENLGNDSSTTFGSTVNCTNHNGTTCTSDCGNNTVEHCYTSIDQECFVPCLENCHKRFDHCDQKCCLLACPVQREVCIENCSEACAMDVACLQGCAFACADGYDRCTLDCIMPAINCRPTCESQYLLCGEDCQPCGRHFPNSNHAESTSNFTGDESYVTGNQTTFYNHTLASSNGTTCLNESGTCNDILNSSTCVNGSLNCTGDATAGFPAGAVMPTAPANCAVEIRNCHLECNETLWHCVDQCPCGESCYSQYSTCRSTCFGCESVCLGDCHSNCSLESNRCVNACALPLINPVVVCAQHCNEAYDACVPVCLYNLTVNITRFLNASHGGPANISEYNTVTFLNNTCVEQCAEANMGCLEPCVGTFSVKTCTNQCFQGRSISDVCSLQCHSVAYVYSNATMNRTYESCYQQCLSGCANWTKNPRSVNSTSSVPTEGPSMDSPSSTSGEPATSDLSTTQSAVEDVTFPSGTASAVNSSTTETHCVRDCKYVFSDSFSNCSRHCGIKFHNCSIQCVAQNSSKNLNQSLSCTQGCGKEYVACSFDCVNDLVFENCSSSCQDVSLTCLDGCHACLDCRDDCHVDCSRQKSLCLGVCFPPTCQEVRSTCLHNCSVCDCTGDCRSNCSLHARDCHQECLPLEIRSCQIAFEECNAQCSNNIDSSSDHSSAGCSLNCSSSYAICVESNLPNKLTFDNFTEARCTDRQYVYSLTNNSSSESNSCNDSTGNQTTDSCSKSTNLTSSCNSLFVAYQVFNHCRSSRNVSMHACVHTCQVCQNDTVCYTTCTAECIRDHYPGFVDCFTAAFPGNCSSNCSRFHSACTSTCVNCTTCPECERRCEADYVNCTSLAGVETQVNLDNTTVNDLSEFHPNCTAYRNCSSSCKSDTSHECSEGSHCSDSNCTRQCLREFIAPNCSSPMTCTVYQSLCGNHQRKRRSASEFDLWKSELISPGNSKMPDFDDLLMHNKIKTRFVKDLLMHPRQSAMSTNNQDKTIGSSSSRGSQMVNATVSLSRTPSPPMKGLHNNIVATNGALLMSYMKAQVNPFWKPLLLDADVATDLSQNSAVSEGNIYSQLVNVINQSAKDKTLPSLKTIHHVHRRSVHSPGNGTALYPNGTSSQLNNTTGFSNTTQQPHATDSRYPGCSSNVLYLHYQTCLQNCSVLTQMCAIQCVNFSAFCNDLYVDTSDCITANSSSPRCTCLNETLTNVGHCIDVCSGSCQDVCEKLRPVEHRECYDNCSETSMYCSGRNQTHSCDLADVTSNSSTSGGCLGSGYVTATNETCSDVTNSSCDSTASDLCAFPQHANLTTCQQHCNQMSSFTDCLQICDNATCLESTTCKCTCKCSSLPAIWTNQSCSYLEWTDYIPSCAVKRISDVCTCACGCVKMARNYAMTRWRALHSNVGSLLGIEVSTNTLYALSHHGLAFLQSNDYGESWLAVTSDVWHSARDGATFVASNRLIRKTLMTMEPKEFIVASGFWNDTWGVSGVGVHWYDESTGEWNVVGTWQCCKDQQIN